MQAASEYQTAKAQIPQLQHQIAQQENALSILVGMNPRQIARSSQFDQLRPHALPAPLPSRVRAAPAAGERRVAGGGTGTAAAIDQPDGVRHAAEQPAHDLLDNPFRLWSIGGSVLAPLLNREALTAQVDVAMASRNRRCTATKGWCATPLPRWITRWMPLRAASSS